VRSGVPPGQRVLRRSCDRHERERGDLQRRRHPASYELPCVERRYHRCMADAAELEQQLKEIETQLDWVRDYL
jgi:hypothetical protein